MYIGGAEHSVLHLLYVRFVAMALKDAGHINFEEPFPTFRAHGLVIKDGAKMSKSKGNVINPDEYIKEFGADALRMYLMFLAPFEYGGDFRDQGILGITRMLDRVWKIGDEKDFIEGVASNELETLLHQTIKKVSEDIESLQYNTAISALMIFLNAFEKSAVRPVGYFRIILLLLAPFAPFITEDLWQGLQSDGEDFKSIHRAEWPSFVEEKTKSDKFTLIIQINGKVRDQIEAPFDATEKDAKKFAMESEKVCKYLDGKTIKKVIFVAAKLINIVV
jgi:leucyl-tRNA synthetase